MAALADVPSHAPPPPSDTGKLASILKKILGKDHTLTSPPTQAQEPKTSPDASPNSGLIRRVSRKVVPGLPRAKTFKRQQSEVREKLEAIQPTSAERRAVSVDRRLRTQRSLSRTDQPLPRASAPDFLEDTQPSLSPPSVLSPQVTSAPDSPLDEKQFLSLHDVNSTSPDRAQRDSLEPVPSYIEALSPIDAQDAQDALSTTTSQYDAMINAELERKWILNLSMHFRDKSRREKFFVTYREDEHVWRRVTISLDYRNAPDDSLEKDLLHIKFQREKSAKIYEAIRDSLQDIQFYPTVTNLKLQTTDGRLHVHVVEDVNEIIHYPTIRMVQHLNCRRIRERDLVFDSHMSGFVYKVRVAGQTLIKKEIPGPDTVDEFLYEVNALNSLQFSQNVIEFYGVVVDDNDEVVKGLLINYAEKGALIDVIYDSQEQEGSFLPWPIREKWARQIVQGLSDVHEAGFVQGDLTLSNIVIDEEDNAKIIDINRRGCPVGWEPPEATPLIDSNQRISMYIGVKSDLYQLGMVLWALATLEDEPEAHRRPLRLDSEIDVPGWYRTMVEYCLHEDPRVRLQATVLLTLFPQPAYDDDFDERNLPSISVDDGYSLQEYTVDGYQRNGHPQTRPVQPQHAWPYGVVGNTHATSPNFSNEPYYYPSRGRSPPRSLPSNRDTYGSPYIPRHDMWSNNVADLSTSPVELGRGDASREMREAEEIVAKVQQDLNQLEAEHAQVTGENQTKRAASATGANQVTEVAAEEIEKPLPLSGGGTEGVTSTSDPNATAFSSEGWALGNLQSEIRYGISEQVKISRSGEMEDMGTPIEQAIQPPMNSGNTPEPLSNHIFEEEGISTRTTGASPSRAAGFRPQQHVPAELTGIGSAYEKQEEFRQPTFSDEDLGLSTTATTNVTSQA
ncbi:hypothetical protein AAE478_001830 [Parahypoxylon ruwenzoriense]